MRKKGLPTYNNPDSFYLISFQHHFLCIYWQNHFTECEKLAASVYTVSLQPAASYHGSHQASYNYSVMWWHGNNGPSRERERQRERVREQISESMETSKEKHIILLCTVCRLKLHNSDTQQHIKRAKEERLTKVSHTQKKQHTHTALLVTKREIVQWITTNKY